jgi:hypothetical protein
MNGEQWVGVYHEDGGTYRTDGRGCGCGCGSWFIQDDNMTSTEYSLESWGLA